MLLVTVSLTLLVVAFASEIVAFLAPGFRGDAGQFALCVRLTKMMAPYIACISLIAMLNSALSTLQIFGSSAWAQVAMNLVLIVGALVAIPFDPQTATIILAGSVLVGGVVQILSQLPACKRVGISIVPSHHIFTREVGEVIRLMLPATVGASVYQISIFIATVLASLLPTGSVSWLFYADRIAQFPIGIFSIALASVLLPALSNASAQADTDSFNRNLANSLRFTSFGIIPMAAGIWALALPITQMLFERGAFTTDSSTKTAAALQALCLGLWATSCYSMVVRAFIARKDTFTPTLIGMASLLANVAISLSLMGPIPVTEGAHALTRGLVRIQDSLIGLSPVRIALGHTGLALASALASFVSLGCALLMFRVKIGTFPWQAFLRSTCNAAGAACVMVVALHYTTLLGLSPFLTCALAIPLGAMVFLAVSYLLRSRELLETAAVVAKKLR
jgi:putative peptidoglycan lipid II flippase